jgi:ATP-dependent Clp protease ATP-binding subunit ClpA
MFERYTEKARRVFFFARYEASQFGASQIEAEHILLGMLREDKQIAARFFPRGFPGLALIRRKIEDRGVVDSRVTVSNVDLPLSAEAKRVLTYAAQESEKLGHRHIGTEHLLLGLLIEEGTIAFKLLTEVGVVLYDVRKVIKENKIKNTRADSRYYREESWPQTVLNACRERGLITSEEYANEFERVAGLREFTADAEALLRLLALKGLADPQRLTTLALELCDEKKLEDFIGRITK